MYKLINGIGNELACISYIDKGLYIPISPDNTDYQQFKQVINEDTAQLEDADGNLMTAEEAKEFVSTLP